MKCEKSTRIRHFYTVQWQYNVHRIEMNGEIAKTTVTVYKTGKCEPAKSFQFHKAALIMCTHYLHLKEEKSQHCLTSSIRSISFLLITSPVHHTATTKYQKTLKCGRIRATTLFRFMHVYFYHCVYGGVRACVCLLCVCVLQCSKSESLSI